VYNQWGERVFETNDIAGGWDGNYKGKPQPVGVYIYVLRVENNNGEVVTKKGSINLIR
jgi:gliding motility-associated-like protein